MKDISLTKYAYIYATMSETTDCWIYGLIYMERGARLKATLKAARVTAEMLSQRLNVPLRKITRLEVGNYGDELLLDQVETILRDVKCQKSRP